MFSILNLNTTNFWEQHSMHLEMLFQMSLLWVHSSALIPLLSPIYEKRLSENSKEYQVTIVQCGFLLLLLMDSPSSIVCMVKKSQRYLLSFFRKSKLNRKSCHKKFQIFVKNQTFAPYISGLPHPFELKLWISS